tara:strand:- start:1280 stop:1840 length:561 start_codon:yes stop_codon:yes gene_type:complete
MKIIKSKNLQETLLNVVLIVGGLFLVAALLHYGNNKNMHKDMMVNGGNVEKPVHQNVASESVEKVTNAIEATTGQVFDSVGSAVSNVQSAVGDSMNAQPVMNPNELLPKQQNANSALMNPPRSDLAGKNFLTAEQSVGINTVGNSLRNANQQLRSDPAIPMNTNVGPWLNSTIEPDNMRRPLEIGA